MFWDSAALDYFISRQPSIVSALVRLISCFACVTRVSLCLRPVRAARTSWLVCCMSLACVLNGRCMCVKSVSPSFVPQKHVVFVA